MHDLQCMACVVCVNKTKVLLIVHTWVFGTTTNTPPPFGCAQEVWVGEVSNEHISNILRAHLLHKWGGHSSPLVGFVLMPNMHPQGVASYSIFYGGLGIIEHMGFTLCGSRCRMCAPTKSHRVPIGNGKVVWVKVDPVKQSVSSWSTINSKSIHWLGQGSFISFTYARNNAKLYANNAGVYGYVWAIVGPLPFMSWRMKMRV